MAQDEARRFLDAVDQDPEMQKKMKAAWSNIVDLGKEHGYDFTMAEFNEHLHERWGIRKPLPEDDPDTTFSF